MSLIAVQQVSSGPGRGDSGGVDADQETAGGEAADTRRDLTAETSLSPPEAW